MPYTAAQLVAAYTAVTNGLVPNAATTATLTSYANQTAAGQLTDAGALGNIINMADSTTAVAVQAYQFFTGKSPSKLGLDFLVNSPSNTADLNDAFYAQFNIENRYINFAANLGLIGEGAAAFAATYGSLSFSTFVAQAYEQIIGSSYATAAGINVTAALADITARQTAFTNTARERGLITAASSAAQVDIATKAAVIGYLLVEGIKADVGLYAAGSNNFLLALITGGAQYNVNILQTYSPQGGGLGLPVPATGVPVALSTGPDVLPGTAGNDAYSGVIFSDSAASSTFGVVDLINAGGGQDMLNLTVVNSAGGATGAVAVPAATLNSVEVLNVRSLSSNAADVTTVSAASFAGLTTANSDRSTNAVTFTQLAANAVVGLIGDGVAATGALTFGYALGGSPAVVNISGGVKGAPNVTLSTVGTTMTVNSTGAAANGIGTLNVNGAGYLTLNQTAILNIAAITGFNPAGGAVLAVTGSATGQSNLGTLAANLTSLDASGLTAAGVIVTLGANPQILFTGGSGSDVVTIAAGTGAALINSPNGALMGGPGADTLIFTAGGDLILGAADKFSGFETLGFTNSGAAGSLQSFNPMLINGVTAFQAMASTGSVQFLNLQNGATVTAVGSLAGTHAAGSLSLTMNNGSGGTDALTLALNNGNTAGAANTSGVSIAKLGMGGSTVAGQIETLNLVSAGSVTGTGTYNSVAMLDSGVSDFFDANAYVVSGSQGLILTTGVIAHAMTVDASAMSGTSGLIFSSAAGGLFGVAVTGSNANDSITFAGNQGGNAQGGGGGDLITLAAGPQVVTYTKATDSLLDTSGVAGASGTGVANVGKMDTIVGFGTGVDKLAIGGDLTGFAGAVIADKAAAASVAALTALVGTATFFQDGGGAVRKVAQVDFNGGTVLVFDTNNSGAYDSGDMAVFLAGINNVASGDLI